MRAVKKRLSPSPSASSDSDLESVPGVGPSIAADLHDLGFRRVADLTGADPERMYADLCRLRGAPVDRCVLYVFRCAAYYAGTPRPRRELLQWWRWTDPAPSSRKRRPAAMAVAARARRATPRRAKAPSRQRTR